VKKHFLSLSRRGSGRRDAFNDGFILILAVRFALSSHPGGEGRRRDRLDYPLNFCLKHRLFAGEMQGNVETLIRMLREKRKDAH
jgi:hypothetical protein